MRHSHKLTPFQGLENILLERLDKRVERPVTRDVPILAKKHGAPGLRADTGLGEAVGERDRCSRKGTQIKGLDHRMSSEAHSIGAQLVWHKHD